jgi:hypothetical protein
VLFSVRAGLAVGLGPAISTADGLAFLRRAAARGEVCPFALDVGRVRPSVCFGASAGPVFASGVDFKASSATTRLWLAVDGVLRWRVSLAGPVFVEIEARASIPLVRDRYIYRPDSTIYEAPVVAGAAAGGAGIHFW